MTRTVLNVIDGKTVAARSERAATLWPSTTLSTDRDTGPPSQLVP